MKEIIIKHRTGCTVLMCVFLIFLGCFSFPVFNLTREFSNFWWISVLVACGGYCEIGYLQGVLYGNKAVGKIIVVAMTFLGFLCRFLLEYGEVSNTYNFTLPNILLHLLVVICITTLTADF